MDEPQRGKPLNSRVDGAHRVEDSPLIGFQGRRIGFDEAQLGESYDVSERQADVICNLVHERRAGPLYAFRREPPRGLQEMRRDPVRIGLEGAVEFLPSQLVAMPQGLELAHGDLLELPHQDPLFIAYEGHGRSRPPPFLNFCATPRAIAPTC